MSDETAKKISQETGFIVTYDEKEKAYVFISSRSDKKFDPPSAGWDNCIAKRLIVLLADQGLPPPSSLPRPIAVNNGIIFDQINGLKGAEYNTGILLDADVINNNPSDAIRKLNDKKAEIRDIMAGNSPAMKRLAAAAGSFQERTVSSGFFEDNVYEFEFTLSSGRANEQMLYALREVMDQVVGGTDADKFIIHLSSPEGKIIVKANYGKHWIFSDPRDKFLEEVEAIKALLEAINADGEKYGIPREKALGPVPPGRGDIQLFGASLLPPGDKPLSEQEMRERGGVFKSEHRVV